MKRFCTMKTAAVSLLALCGALALAPAHAAPRQVIVQGQFFTPHQVTIQGQSFWTGSLETSDPGTFFDSGQARFDPNGYLDYGEGDEDLADQRQIIYANHPGAARCILRKRVVNTTWEFEHPYLAICRP
jgi:hypothetical protein